MTAPIVQDTIFEQAIAIADERQRSAFLDQACSGNSDLRREAEQMVRDHFRAGSFLERPALALDATLPPSSDHVGSQIGPYKLLEQIGEGGMGVVFVAEQTQPMRRRVALKIIKPGMDTRQVIARFEAERQALAMMDHPNIAKILDAGTTDEKDEGGRMEDAGTNSSLIPHPSSFAAGRPYFVMELVRGMPITQYCGQARVGPRQWLKLFIDVCHAVQHAHQKGIIHRDLKPSNILVTLHDGTPLVKVIDFGVAKALGHQLTEHTVYTALTQLIGTPLYMSPEQAELSALDVDTRSDVYSLGVLLYELLTGTTPFDKERLKSASFDEMRRIIREEEPETVSQRLARTQRTGTRGLGLGAVDANGDPAFLAPSPQTPAPRLTELDWIVTKSLEKDRTRRYESASAFAADIQRYLSDEPVLACPPSAAYRFRKFAHKHGAALAMAAAIATTLIVCTTVSGWQAIRATAAEAQASANETKARSEEQKAIALARSEAAQRERAEANFLAALDAVDRMLTHVSDAELNDVPRVGPLRRKILKDAIAFYERIPLRSAVSIASRRRIAQTWERIARLSDHVDDCAQARDAGQKAVLMLKQLASEVKNSWGVRKELADTQVWLGRLFRYRSEDYEEAANLFRSSERLFADLAEERPEEGRWAHSQIDALKYLSEALYELGRKNEALGCLERALDLINQCQAVDTPLHARIIYNLAQFTPLDPDSKRSDELFRRAIDMFREHQTGDKASKTARLSFGHILCSSAVRNDYRWRKPLEAERMLDESIAVLRTVCGENPSNRSDAEEIIRPLASQIQFLRDRAAAASAKRDQENAAQLIARADELSREMLARQRQIASRFALPEDQYQLVKLLQEEGEYILRQLSTQSDQPEAGAADRNLTADALIAEAAQLCHTLTAQFPDKAEYTSRLDALLRLQTTHFSDKRTNDAHDSSAAVNGAEN